MSEQGIRKTHDILKEKLSNYIKAQYFAENQLLLDATEELLGKKGVLFQEPFIEATNSYAIKIDGFDDADLPDKIKTYLNELINHQLGVFNSPFSHQVKSIEEYYNPSLATKFSSSGCSKALAHV